MSDNVSQYIGFQELYTKSHCNLPWLQNGTGSSLIQTPMEGHREIRCHLSHDDLGTPCSPLPHCSINPNLKSVFYGVKLLPVILAVIVCSQLVQ